LNSYANCHLLDGLTLDSDGCDDGVMSAEIDAHLLGFRDIQFQIVVVALVNEMRDCIRVQMFFAMAE
jgi:hypothetical protein